jgi:hypothetical protein
MAAIANNRCKDAAGLCSEANYLPASHAQASDSLIRQSLGTRIEAYDSAACLLILRMKRYLWQPQGLHCLD